MDLKEKKSLIDGDRLTVMVPIPPEAVDQWTNNSRPSLKERIRERISRFLDFLVDHWSRR